MKRVSFSCGQYAIAFRIVVLLSIFVFSSFSQLYADLLIYNSPDFSNNDATRTSWLAGCGISAPDYLVNFETGFTDEQNITGVTGLFPAGLVIRDTGSHGAIIQSGNGSIGASNPVGNFALTTSGSGYLVLDFSAAPINYLAFQDIDQPDLDVTVTFVGGSTVTIDLDTTSISGDSAEFVGLLCNDRPRIISLQMNVGGSNDIWGIDNIEYGTLVPIPTAIWLFGSGLIGLFGIRKRIRGGNLMP